jgi:hypothetical protein
MYQIRTAALSILIALLIQVPSISKADCGLVTNAGDLQVYCTGGCSEVLSREATIAKETHDFWDSAHFDAHAKCYLKCANRIPGEGF